MTSKEFETLLAKGKKVSVSEGFRYAEQNHDWLNAQGKSKLIAFKIADKVYQEWYDKGDKRYSLYEETIYLTNTRQKAFGNYGGYSIFGISLADMKREEKNIYNEGLQRIEHLELEYAVILED